MVISLLQRWTSYRRRRTKVRLSVLLWIRTRLTRVSPVMLRRLARTFQVRVSITVEMAAESSRNLRIQEEDHREPRRRSCGSRIARRRRRTVEALRSGKEEEKER